MKKRVLILGLLAILLTFYILRWGYIYIYLPLQGQLVGVLPDTSWIQNDQRIFYLDKDSSLYSIKINGKEKRKITDNVDRFLISPDGSKVAVWNRLKSWKKKSPEIWSDISVVDVSNGQRTVVENKTNCSVPMWLPEGTRIIYELEGQRNGFCIFNIKNHEKKFVFTGELVSDMTITSDGQNIIYVQLYSKRGYKYNIATESLEEIHKFRVNSQLRSIYEFIDESEEYSRNLKQAPVFQDGVVWGPASRDETVKTGTKNGSLWISQNGQEKLLVKYRGQYNSLVAPGIEPFDLSIDRKYIVFGFKQNLYVYDLQLSKVGLLTEGYHSEFLKD